VKKVQTIQISNSIKLKVFSSLDKAIKGSTELFINFAQTKPSTFFLSGGKSPIPFYRKLAKSNLNWKGISLIPADERIVQHSSKFSNTGMIEKELIANIKSKEKPFLIKDYPRYNKEINSKLDQLSNNISNNYKPKVAFLGIGVDGHTAGLFDTVDKGYENSTIKNKKFNVLKREVDSFCRVSISMRFLLTIPNLVFFVTGKEKQLILTKILKGKESAPNFEYPTSFLLSKGTGEKIIICDQLAAPINYSTIKFNSI
jgi:6-phosphogluconolactonase